jgi:hypothetical protein
VLASRVAGVPPSVDDRGSIKLPDIHTDSDGSEDHEEYPTWTQSPELMKRLQTQELEGESKSQKAFGPVAKYTLVRRGSSSVEMPSPSPSPGPSEGHPSGGYAVAGSHNEGPYSMQTQSRESQRPASLHTDDLSAKPQRRVLRPRHRIDLAKTGFAAQPRRRPRRREPASTGATVPKSRAANLSQVTIQDRIGSSYKRLCPAILHFLDFRPVVSIIQYSEFYPYRLNPHEKAILTLRDVSLIEKEAAKIVDDVPSSLDDNQLDQVFDDGFKLENLPTSATQSVLDVAESLFREKKRSKDIGNILDFLHLSVVRVYQSMASPEEVCLHPETMKKAFDPE